MKGFEIMFLEILDMGRPRFIDRISRYWLIDEVEAAGSANESVSSKS